MGADVGGLDSGAIGDEEVAECHGVGDSVWCLAIFVALLDAALQSGQSLLDTFAREAWSFCARDGFAGGGGHPFSRGARGLDIALGLQEG